MALYALEHFRTFRRLLAQHGGRRGWAFHVQLAFLVDGEDGDPRRPTEHLWFEVERIDGPMITATLVSRPAFVARLARGQRDRHTLDQVSNWAVTSPHGSFDASRIDALIVRTT